MISDEQKHPFGDKKESVEESSSERKFNFLQLLLPNAVFPFGVLLKKQRAELQFGSEVLF